MLKNFLKIIIYIYFFSAFALTSAFAQSAEYDAKAQYLCALMSMTAYNDKYGDLARNVLTSYGWDFNFLEAAPVNGASKFFTAANTDFIPGENSYLLSVRGTDDLKDVSSDMKINMVPFSGNDPSSIANGQLPMVHSGFNRYVQAAFFTSQNDKPSLGEKFISILRNDPHAHLYITGHSLGGAAAILTAAKLISMGLDPSRISVITFGAPAVGNEAFAKTYGENINLSRIVLSGDPVRNLVQVLNPNYRQFGREIKYAAPPSFDDKIRHKILLYLDICLREYYDKKEPAASSSAGKIFFAKPTFNIDFNNDNENIDFYIRSVLQDNISHYIKNTVWENSSVSPPAFSAIKYLVKTDITITRQKYVKNSFYVSTAYTIYTAESGRLLTSFSAASDTVELTPIEAVLYNNISLEAELKKSLSQENL
ncbi:lipase family protein [Pectinatus haikarae]|uniref:lipase family protein n=1 Tax=Pectinatus haikarae TaxID=349096 RepID=UPI0018C56425|nr:lipase family protein [Pectinatus haikarae]